MMELGSGREMAWARGCLETGRREGITVSVSSHQGF